MLDGNGEVKYYGCEDLGCALSDQLLTRRRECGNAYESSRLHISCSAEHSAAIRLHTIHMVGRDIGGLQVRGTESGWTRCCSLWEQ